MRLLNPSSRDAIRECKFASEEGALETVRTCGGLTSSAREAILGDARALLFLMRAGQSSTDLLQRLFQEMDLGSTEGLSLMALAESLLRTPDTNTAQQLIREKLSGANWQRFRETASSTELKGLGVLLNVAAKLVEGDSALGKVTAGLSLPTIHAAARQIVHVLAKRFVFAPTVDEAVTKAEKGPAEFYSFDMLGEGARTYEQAAQFRASYANAIARIGSKCTRSPSASGISVKISALHPRFEAARQEQLRKELYPVVEDLVSFAMKSDVGFTIDAEEADRLEPTLDLFEHLLRGNVAREWDGFGLAVQAYSKRALTIVKWLNELGDGTRRCFRVRLVKGAYWDAEIKRAQAEGLPDYPVFTRKQVTDVSYLACATEMLASQWIIPQFATHNVHTVCSILHIAGKRPFEFQRLHGMGERLYDTLRARGKRVPVRVYAPVGQFDELLPYLIRRMLENTANSSFVRTALDHRQPIEKVIQDPISILEEKPSSKISLPVDIFPGRRNSQGLDLADPRVLGRLSRNVRASGIARSRAFVGDRKEARIIRSPTDRRVVLGAVPDASLKEVGLAIDAAATAFEKWSKTHVEHRARILEDAADAFERRREEFIALIVTEAGRTLRDAVAEVRETVDFCRYYALEARRILAEQPLSGIAGERNVLQLRGKGVFGCISPWNFPLAIFVGQVVAALVTGNTVVAKPAEQTPLTASLAMEVLHAAGVPKAACHLICGDVESGRHLTAHPGIAGIAFTGSTSAAHSINRALAARDAPIATLIAETGGIIAMLVDSTALPEQVVDDVITSGFLSAGQRCSSLRHLLVQEDNASAVLDVLAGAMATLRIGDPSDPTTDIGPLIDETACDTVDRHVEDFIVRGAKILARPELPADLGYGCFTRPTLLELPETIALDREIFGPVVHVTRWRRDTLDEVLNQIRKLGYGLTVGIHSRIAGFSQHVIEKVRCGNAYINRNMIGAVVGTQPFGGRGLSGTGPKAGGPHYLQRFVTEDVVTTNLAAIGGDVELFTA